jgi:hypothetical protein
MPPVRPASQGRRPAALAHVTAMHRSLVFPILVAALALGVPNPSHADTSATLATAINLPRGPASIEGLGTGYEVGPADGLPALSFPLEVPPGRAGLVPELALHYHPGAGVDVLGLGWSLRLPAIERSLRRGVPRYDEGDVWTLKNLGDGEELTVVSPGVLRQRIEQGPPVFVTENPDGSMTARTTDGTRYLFGLTADARLARDGDVFRLELSAVVDPHGNRIDFTYARQEWQRPAAPRPHRLERRRRRRALRLRAAARPRHHARSRLSQRARPPPGRHPDRGRRGARAHHAASLRAHAAVPSSQLAEVAHRRRRRDRARAPALRIHRARRHALESFASSSQQAPASASSRTRPTCLPSRR